MKIRILANTIRYRLRQPEISLFQESGKVMEVTEFGPGLTDGLGFILKVISGTELTVSFEYNTTTIGVPRYLAEEWINTDLVGFDGKIDTGKGRIIEVLVEKDFACLDNPEEDNIGAFPNPKAVC